MLSNPELDSSSHCLPEVAGNCSTLFISTNTLNSKDAAVYTQVTLLDSTIEQVHALAES